MVYLAQISDTQGCWNGVAGGFLNWQYSVTIHYSHWKTLPATNHLHYSAYTFFFIYEVTLMMCKKKERACMHESGYLSSCRWQDKEGRILYWGKTYKAGRHHL